jgi:hypothetical protein
MFPQGNFYANNFVKHIYFSTQVLRACKWALVKGGIGVKCCLSLTAHTFAPQAQSKIVTTALIVCAVACCHHGLSP